MSDDTPNEITEAELQQLAIHLSTAMCECVEMLIRLRGDSPEEQEARNAFSAALDFTIECIDTYLPEAEVFDTISRVWFAIEPVTHVREEQA